MTLAKAHAAVDPLDGDIHIPGGYNVGDSFLHVNNDGCVWVECCGPLATDWRVADEDDERRPLVVYVNDDIGDAAYLLAVRLAEKYGVRLVVRS